MEVYWLMMVIQVTSSSHVVHVSNSIRAPNANRA